MSDLEKIDVVLVAYSRNELGSSQNDREIYVNLESNEPQQSSDISNEDFRSLLNTK